jgi:dihydroorotase
MRSLLAAVLLAFPAVAQYDLLLKNAHVIDPRNGVDGRMDVAIQARKVARIAPSIDSAQARKAIELAGLYLTPGLVDIHAHVFNTTGIHNAWAGDNSVAADSFSFRTGVTTMVDAGSSGWRNFEDFRHHVIDRVKTRVLAFINIAGLGMITDVTEQEPSDFKPEEVARLARKHKDVVVGVKTAHYQHPDWTSVDRAVEAGNLAGIPVMVDFGYFLPERPYWQLVTERLRPGDISTHMFRAPVPWVDENAKVYDYLRRARERGVKFDVGHGGGSFVFRNAVPATEQGFFPDTISTDLHTASMNGAMIDMPTTMSKFLAMGMPLRDVVRASTSNPAQIIQHPELGQLSAGAVADIAVWKLLEGEFAFADAAGGRITGKRRLACEMALKDGEIAWDWNARGAVDYRKLPATYGIRPGIDHIVRPPK